MIIEYLKEDIDMSDVSPSNYGRVFPRLIQSVAAYMSAWCSVLISCSVAVRPGPSH